MCNTSVKAYRHFLDNFHCSFFFFSFFVPSYLFPSRSSIYGDRFFFNILFLTYLACSFDCFFFFLFLITFFGFLLIFFLHILLTFFTFCYIMFLTFLFVFGILFFIRILHVSLNLKKKYASVNRKHGKTKT